MKLSRTLVLAASAVAITGSLGFGANSVSATTQHCETDVYPNKVNVDAGPVFDTDLPEGTEVCIKAGNEITVVTAGPGGVIENEAILNTKGKAKGISYYAYGDVCTDPYGCNPNS